MNAACEMDDSLKPEELNLYQFVARRPTDSCEIFTKGVKSAIQCLQSSTNLELLLLLHLEWAPDI